MVSIDRLIEILEAFKRRKGMYVQPVEIVTINSYLAGFTCGCLGCGFEITQEILSGAAADRGWKRTGLGPVPQMRDKGMPEESIMDELIEIHIDSLYMMKEIDRRVSKEEIT